MDQQLLVGIVGGLIGWLIGTVALHAILSWLYPATVSPRRLNAFLKAQEKAMQGFIRTATGKDPGEPR